jgi:hypothetical protein
LAPPQPGGDGSADGARQRKNLFIYVPLDDSRFRMITADRARIDGPDASGSMLVRLRGFASRTLVDAPIPESGPKSETDRGPLYATGVDDGRDISELLPFAGRGSDGAELTVFEQMRAHADPDLPEPGVQLRMLGERVARSFLCLLAPLIAMGAVCLTSRRTHYLALPLACMLLMSLNVTAEWLIRTLAPSSAIEVLAVLAILTIAAMAGLLAGIIRGQGLLFRPQLARA